MSISILPTFRLYNMLLYFTSRTDLLKKFNWSCIIISFESNWNSNTISILRSKVIKAVDFKFKQHLYFRLSSCHIYNIIHNTFLIPYISTKDWRVTHMTHLITYTYSFDLYMRNIFFFIIVYINYQFYI